MITSTRVICTYEHGIYSFMMHSQGKTSDDEEEGQLLGTFSYDKSGPPIQEYTVHVCCNFHIIISCCTKKVRLSKQYGKLVTQCNMTMVILCFYRRVNAQHTAMSSSNFFQIMETLNTLVSTECECMATTLIRKLS